MRKILMSLIAALFIVKSSGGQILSATEMIKQVNCKTFDCFNIFIVTKGFSFDGARSQNGGDNMESYHFLPDHYEKGNLLESQRNTVSFAVTRNKEISYVLFSTPSKTVYLNLTNSFERLGFVFAKTNQTNNGVSNVYTSNAYPKILLTIATGKLPNNEMPNYDFIVELHHNFKQ